MSHENQSSLIIISVGEAQELSDEFLNRAIQEIIDGKANKANSNVLYDEYIRRLRANNRTDLRSQIRR